MKRLKVIIGIIAAGIIATITGYIIWQWDRDPWNTDESRYYVYNEQLPYYRKNKQTVMKMLPKPASDYIDTIYVDSLYNHWPQYEYRLRMEKKGDSVMTINVVDWDLDERKSRLQIIFVLENGQWIVHYAGQWDPNAVVF